MKRLVKSLLVWVVLVLVYVIGSNILHSPSLKDNATSLSRLADSPAELAIWGLHLIETKGDKLLWEMEADSAHMYHQQQSTQFENVKLTLYQEQNPVLRLEGKKAKLNMDSRDVTLEGKVVASFQDGLTFKTDSLSWWSQKRMLSTPDAVKITKPHIQIQGQGLEADLGLERLKINNRVTTIIN